MCGKKSSETYIIGKRFGYIDHWTPPNLEHEHATKNSILIYVYRDYLKSINIDLECLRARHPIVKLRIN